MKTNDLIKFKVNMDMVSLVQFKLQNYSYTWNISGSLVIMALFKILDLIESMTTSVKPHL